MAAFLTFLGSVWIQEQRRRHDLLREKLEILLEQLQTLAKAPWGMDLDLAETDWSERPEAILDRLKLLNGNGLRELIGAVVKAMSVAEVYFPSYAGKIRALGNQIGDLVYNIKDSKANESFDLIHSISTSSGSLMDEIHREFATLTKSTFIPSEI